MHTLHSAAVHDVKVSKKEVNKTQRNLLNKAALSVQSSFTIQFLSERQRAQNASRALQLRKEKKKSEIESERVRRRVRNQKVGERKREGENGPV